MARLVMLFTHPDDQAVFDRCLQEDYLPRARALPGLRRLDALRVAGGPLALPPYYLVLEMTFDDDSALRTAVASEEGRRAQQALAFAPGLATTLYCEEEDTGD